jgi:beta-phosphoglucomutase-like phosphatase (HAD superfamily)
MLKAIIFDIDNMLIDFMQMKREASAAAQQP